MFIHVRVEVFRQINESVQAKDLPDADPLTRLRSMAAALAEFGRAAPDDYRLAFSMRQSPGAPDSPLAEARRHLGNHVIAVCQLAIEAGQLQGEAAQQAYLIWASIHGLLSLHVSNHLNDGPDLDSLLQPMLIRLFGVAPKPARPKPAKRG